MNSNRTDAVIPTTREISAACDRIDGVIKLFLAARAALPPLGKFESHIEAIHLMYLAIRHIEGVLELARRDLTLAPPAMVLARAALETAVKAAWMTKPENPYEREARWLAHLEEEERFHRRTAERLDAAGLSPATARGVADSIAQFRQGVTALLPPGVALIKRNPSTDEMLREVSAPGLYVAYINFSQFAHGGHAATGTYRRHFGTTKEFGEFISPSTWHAPLLGCWVSLRWPGQFVLGALGGGADTFLGNTEIEHVDASIEAVLKDSAVH